MWFFQQLNTFCCLWVALFSSKELHFESYIDITCSVLPGLLVHEYHTTTAHLWLAITILHQKKPQASSEVQRQIFTACSAALSSVILSKIDLQNLSIYSSWRLWCLTPSRSRVCTSIQDVQSLGKCWKVLEQSNKIEVLAKQRDCKSRNMPVCTRNRKSLHGDGTASAAEENDPVCIRAAYSHSPCCGYTEHVSLPTSLASVPLLHHRSSTTEGIISTSFSVAGCFPEVLQGKGSTHMLESSSTRLNPWLGLREVSRRITVKLLKTGIQWHLKCSRSHLPVQTTTKFGSYALSTWPCRRVKYTQGTS